MNRQEMDLHLERLVVLYSKTNNQKDQALIKMLVVVTQILFECHITPTRSDSKILVEQSL